ncbi:MAG: FAD-dependent oxidoreductase, partial [Alphaproteobacteria bacterium]|nr:FAD-dependent oxidoreductase [Alphaproteobacteria bacterium]
LYGSGHLGVHYFNCCQGSNLGVLQSTCITYRNSVVDDISGQQSITGIVLKNVVTDEKKNIELSGLFLAIGHQPNTDIFKKYLTLDEDGYIITHPNSCATSIPGVFAAGDVKDKAYQQAIIAAGSGAMAAIEAGRYLTGVS